MKPINIVSLTQAFQKMDADLFKAYLSFNEISPKTEELKDISCMLDELRKTGPLNNLSSHYYIGFTIPQISKEFDLLRFDKKSIVNIEIKRDSTEVKIFKQLVRNKYYLSFLNKKVLNFSFIVSVNKLFTLNIDDKLEEVPISELYRLLTNQKVIQVSELSSLFNPSNYLVSPFNSTERFIDGEYFLTAQQEEIEKSASKK